MTSRPEWFGQADGCHCSTPIYGEGVLCGVFAVMGVHPIATIANRRALTKPNRGRIGDGCVIGCHAVIYCGVFLGNECRVGDHATIREDTRIGDRCVIGTGVDIQYGAMIGDDVRILNEAHIAGGTIIGNNSFIGPGVRTANDRRINLDDYQDHGTREAPYIGANVMIGVGATLLPGVIIGDGATVAAGAVVVHNVAAGETVFGCPARPRISQPKADRHMFDGR